MRYKVVLVIAGLIIVGATKYFVDVRQTTRMRDIGYRIEQYRQQVVAAENINSSLCSGLAEAQSPDVVKRRLLAFGIVLARPPLERVIHVPMPDQIDGLPAERIPQAAEADERLARAR